MDSGLMRYDMSRFLFLGTYLLNYISKLPNRDCIHDYMRVQLSKAAARIRWLKCGKVTMLVGEIVRSIEVWGKSTRSVRALWDSSSGAGATLLVLKYWI